MYRVEPSAVEGIFAVVALSEFALNPLRSPDLSARSLGMFLKVLISCCEMLVDGLLRGFERKIIAVVNDRSCHSAEDGFDDVEELRPGRQRDRLYNRVDAPVRICAGGHQRWSSLPRQLSRARSSVVGDDLQKLRHNVGTNTAEYRAKR